METTRGNTGKTRKTGECSALMALALPFLFCAGPAGAQQEPFNISVDVDLVVLHATVRDRHGHDVVNLSRQDFRLFEDGVAQTISLFRREDTPVTVGLVVDHSGSMAPKLSEVIAASRIFAHSSNPMDQMFVINFSDGATFGITGPDRFTESPAAFESAISQAPAAGRTALYDAIALGLGALKQGRWDKKVLVVISDGGDNASTHTLADVTALAEQSSAVIYTIGLFSRSDEDRDPVVLKRLAQSTGGEAFFPEEFRDVPDICAHIASDIRNQYMIGYASTNVRADGSLRTIRLEAEAPGHGRLRVRTRAGYIPEEHPQ